MEAVTRRGAFRAEVVPRLDAGPHSRPERVLHDLDGTRSTVPPAEFTTAGRALWEGLRRIAPAVEGADAILGLDAGGIVPALAISLASGLPYTDGIRVEPVMRAGLKTLISRFARCDVVLGNDTGLTHLAALASRRAEVIGLYGRHSHSKWRTGLARHHALATPFSESMHRWDMCPVRDGLDDAEGERYVPLSAISPVALADTAVLALERGYL
jgi:hypothetical protein